MVPMSVKKDKQNNMMTILLVALLVTNGFLMWNMINKPKNSAPTVNQPVTATNPSNPNEKLPVTGKPSTVNTPIATPSSDALKPYASVINKAQKLSVIPKRKVATILAQEALYLIKSNANVVFLDVRSIDEYKTGHAPLSLNFPLYSIDVKSGKLKMNKPFIQELQSKVSSKQWSYKTPIILIDSDGTRSVQAGAIMQGNSFQEVYVVAGGYDGFNKENKSKPENQLVGPKSLREMTRNFVGIWLVDEKGESEAQPGWIELGFPIITGSTEAELLTIPAQTGLNNPKKDSIKQPKERYEVK